MLKVSFILLSYNQSKYIADAVNAALAQSYPNIEFIFSDDCSTDDTFEQISSISKFSKKNIILNKNNINLGLSAHFNLLLRMATGDIIVVAAGDDVSLPERVERTVEYFELYPEITFLSFNDELIDENSNMVGFHNLVVKEQLFTLNDFISGSVEGLSAASRGFRRGVYEHFGALNEDCPTEDTPYILRNLMLGKGLLSPFAGIKYRVHSASLSDKENLRKMDHNKIDYQYRCDANIALNNNVICRETYDNLIHWCEYFTSIKNISSQGNYFLKVIRYMKLLLCNKYFRRSFLLKLGVAFK
ncbi:glycosyltransferase family 2 protein [Shewanella mangrovisoli]|uniref:glycosyltransferase family 2 protein n=1 Tax=Shewanella mangrovisoli TaxID=2864211 RepID=UPI00002D946B